MDWACKVLKMVRDKVGNSSVEMTRLGHIAFYTLDGHSTGIDTSEIESKQNAILYAIEVANELKRETGDPQSKIERFLDVCSGDSNEISQHADDLLEVVGATTRRSFPVDVGYVAPDDETLRSELEAAARWGARMISGRVVGKVLAYK